jgi:hypothetical protein
VPFLAALFPLAAWFGWLNGAGTVTALNPDPRADPACAAGRPCWTAG